MRVLAGILSSILWLGSVSPAVAQATPESPRENRRPRRDRNRPAPQRQNDPDAPAPENLDAAQRARAHFREGMSHFEAREFREAIQQFELAAGLVPSADLWFNIARAHEELSQYEQAIDYYQRYLRDRVDPPDKAEVEALIASLEERAEAARLARHNQPTTGTIRVHTTQDEAEIEIDEARIGRSPLDLPLSVGPGGHALSVTREGYVPFRAEVQVEPGVTTGAFADLVPETRYRAIRGRRIWTWVTAGLAGAALGASLGLGIKGLRLNEDGTRERAADYGMYSDYALGAGIVLAVTAAVLYFVEGRSVGTERIGPDGEAVPVR